MRRLTAREAFRAACVGVALVLAARAGRFGRRAMLRGSLAALATSLVSRPRATGALAGAAVASAIEAPVVAAPVGLATVSALRGRGDVWCVVIGAGIALASTRAWPTAPRTVEDLRRHGTKRHVEPSNDGSGVVVVVNPGARTVDDAVTDRVREVLPACDLVVAGPDDDLAQLLDDAARRAGSILGALGGDGTMSAAAAHAHDHGLTLLALPGGTLNHFTRDLGVLTIDDALEAVRSGEVVEVDLGDVGGQVFVNTCSFGAYTELVAAREALEPRVGKWPAMVVALARELRRAEPVELTVDGRRRRLWLGFVGNCTYEPPGFAPTWREVLDDGALDIRLVDAAPPFARVRLILSVLTGRLGRSAVYEDRRAPTLELASTDGAMTLATDGELQEVGSRVRIRKRDRPLAVLAPHR